MTPTNAACPGETTAGFTSATGADNGCRPYKANFPLAHELHRHATRFRDGVPARAPEHQARHDPARRERRLHSPEPVQERPDLHRGRTAGAARRHRREHGRDLPGARGGPLPRTAGRRQLLLARLRRCGRNGGHPGARTRRSRAMRTPTARSSPTRSPRSSRRLLRQAATPARPGSSTRRPATRPPAMFIRASRASSSSRSPS